MPSPGKMLSDVAAIVDGDDDVVVIDGNDDDDVARVDELVLLCTLSS